METKTANKPASLETQLLFFYFDGPVKRNEGKFMTLPEILEFLEKQSGEKPDAPRLVLALKKRGYERWKKYTRAGHPWGWSLKITESMNINLK
jgi:hypothetical protein